MAIKVAINGFGRIGRLVFRHLFNDPGYDIVAVNDLTSPQILAHLLKYDSVHGRFPGEVTATETGIQVGKEKFEVLSERDPSKLPWQKLGVDVAIESTGLFTKRDDAAKHLAAGAKRVMISAPATDPDVMIVMGVNDDQFDGEKHKIISTASCTTNCLAPVAKVIHDSFGIKRGFMTTIHAYTNDQRILDQPHKDLRRARAAAVSMIPTTTGAARAVSKVLPELKGRLDGMAVRVPTSDGSLVDLTFETEKDASIEAINAAVRDAARGKMKKIIEYTEDPIVSVDVIGNPHSAVFDAKSTMAVGDRFFKVLAWYDNEFGYSGRMVDMLRLIGR
ncbi:MAG: type I glyceraldehyde-3-phosphate dehydrogenase [Candidatus Krumholzibacteria bacterium]|nr:type I glyceraldehyde-3-phosphate dehydrogenase [Candidatus Krumholzibacteria bacterium]MDH4336065.1 type I glyceraldehyde-3-phosphate dehydrogenase [Candidatus Krumholzibacteria bacterium]MDH5268359.1 type I glyceraldehyde-3-phosphate dehydrogenase [Candidatus Krumholzibacteria bacterium]